jgi:hypothetical protein
MFDEDILEQMMASNEVRANIKFEADRKDAIRKAGVEAIERVRNSV